MSEIEPKLDEIDSKDANYIRELSQRGRIAKGNIHGPKGELIRADGGIVSCPECDGEIVIIKKGKTFRGDVYITGIIME
ncbi:MAG: hypothetical protein KAI57_02035 [Candidatus Pacebacteria bacterium]|nr:hypothetical protein [Candidatus Paceibacterota bacterium]